MTHKKSASKIRNKINQIYEENELANLESQKNRARSFTVGTALGGSVEISMRGDYGSMWVTLQPVEAVEIIEQLASSIGLQIAMRPRQDFASWRGWNVEASDRFWAGAGQWQIEQAEFSHRKMLREMETEEENQIQKLLPSSNKTTKKRRTLTKEEKDKMRIEKDLKNQERCRNRAARPGLKNLKKLRDQLMKDHNEYLQTMNPDDEPGNDDAIEVNE